jgi:hypothetical protein
LLINHSTVFLFFRVPLLYPNLRHYTQGPRDIWNIPSTSNKQKDIQKLTGATLRENKRQETKRKSIKKKKGGWGA